MKLAIVITVLLVIFYLMASFVAMSFNPYEWGIGLRSVCMIGFIAVVIYIDYAKD
jgi:hypothetical protein